MKTTSHLRLARIAAKGLTFPKGLTPQESRTLCLHVLMQALGRKGPTRIKSKPYKRKAVQK